MRGLVKAAWTIRGLTPPERLVLLALVTHANWRTGEDARPGVETLAELCGVNRRTIQRALRTLEERRLIARQAEAGHYLAVTYRLFPDMGGVLSPLSLADKGGAVPPSTDRRMGGSMGDSMRGGTPPDLKDLIDHPSPLTPLPGGPVKLSRHERKTAERIRTVAWGRCKHEPRCPDFETCLVELALELRARRRQA